MVMTGRIMIVSDREDVVAELEPIIRAGRHLALSVKDGDEALRTLDEGLVPDLVISDLGSSRSLEGIEYVWRFREMNRVGRHMVVVEEGAPFSGAFGGDLTTPQAEQITALSRPFRPAEVKERIEDAVLRIDQEFRALRGEMWREMSRLQQGMRDMQRETVNALAATIAARDPYMHGHATRVAELCRRVAVAMGVGNEDLELLETAALLHEIGKASVPLELLHKTEPLNTEELERIRAHARIGADIVRGVPSLRRVAPVIEHQGTDFRDLRLRMDPSSTEFLLAGILRVVDAYDAMVSARSYRGPMSREYWQSTLRSGASWSFHPEVVKTFLALMNSAGAPSPAAAAAAAALRGGVPVAA
ncbi:MAG TPA: HD domain-containing phosphohydrolase [Longimicrobium sp.]|nr:HD domain-containing phosphohydrolase [Longimicrobium sp.]